MTNKTSNSSAPSPTPSSGATDSLWQPSWLHWLISALSGTVEIEKETARLKHETAKLREQNAKLREEDAKLREEDAKLDAIDAKLDAIDRKYATEKPSFDTSSTPVNPTAES